MKRNKRIGLGLRATPLQRNWMTKKAAEKGISVQSFFDEIMRQLDTSPWVPEDRIIVPVPVECQKQVLQVCEIYESRNKDLIFLLSESLRAFHSLVKPQA